MKRILWIEDDAKTHLLQFKTLLIRDGYSVDIASDATEAIVLLRKEKYDLLMVDMIIPEGNEFSTDEKYVGFGLLKRLIHIEGYETHQIFVFTQVTDPTLRCDLDKLKGLNILHKGLVETSFLKQKVDNAIRVL